MLLSEHKDLKLEIKSLPEKEKDKLLLRLIAKDKVLTEHLHFKLLEDEHDLVERYEKLLATIDETAKDLLSNKKLTSKDTLLRMRKLNGSISHHFKVTKDVTTEMELRIHLLNQIPIDFKEGIFSPLHKFNEKLSVYFVKSTVSVLNKFYKLHEDLQFDLKDRLDTVLSKIYQNKTSSVALELGLPKEL
ncbi:hypothetical protein [Pedobacter panaciterrae]|jgi:hypothetical protein|uniref:Hemerythrin HHE cation binding domain-containing protein n=1 Tax=Pedobacter panaciterrae TaxID=363849 RepID=A0ABU8NT11_9SPHI|nr:hypothetical protein [Pedobacter panaciterrae]NQX52412.1 hypothetical protein [Pedobacter panaciterrae]